MSITDQIAREWDRIMTEEDLVRQIGLVAWQIRVMHNDVLCGGVAFPVLDY
jgi:hypothetical protein